MNGANRHSFTTMTYNIMHKLDATRTSKYHYCAPRTLNHQNRVQKVEKEIIALNPDILCLQEIDKPTLAHIETAVQNIRLKNAIHLLRDTIPAADGCSIFYNTSRFELIDTHSFKINNLVYKYLSSESQSNHDKAISFWRELRDKIAVGLIATLRHKESRKIVHAATSHLFWDPLFPDIKAFQAYLLCQEIDTYIDLFDSEIGGESNKRVGGLMKSQLGRKGGAPVVLGGDFNSLPFIKIDVEEPDLQKTGQTIKKSIDSSKQSAVYELLTKGVLNSKHPEHPITKREGMNSCKTTDIPHSLSLNRPYVSSYKSVMGHEPNYTNYTAHFKGCLDYVFTDNLDVIGALEMPEESLLSSHTALPSPNFPSDHLPLMVHLALREKV